MEYTFKKWRRLKSKFKLAVLIPVFSLVAFSGYYVFSQYNDFLKEVAHKNDLKKMLSMSTLKLEIAREMQSMRSFYLGVQNFDHLRLQKEFTDNAIKEFQKSISNQKDLAQRFEARVLAPLSVARDQVLSGQSRWPETQKKMEEVRGWLSGLNPNYNDSARVFPYGFQLDKLQEGVVSARELKNNLSFVIVRDMPLNSIQFSNLISSYERAQYLHQQIAEFLLTGTDRMKFLYNQQMIMWGKINADYEKTVETIEQGRYGIRLPELIKRFERLEKSQMAPVQLKKESIQKSVMKSLSQKRTEFLYGFLAVSGLVLISLRLAWSSYRKGLFYIATSFSGHEIKIITEKVHEDKILPLQQLSPSDEEYLEHVNKHIA